MVTNTLAYCNTELITAVKSFIVQAIAGVATMTSKLLHNQNFFLSKLKILFRLKKNPPGTCTIKLFTSVITAI